MSDSPKWEVLIDWDFGGKGIWTHTSENGEGPPNGPEELLSLTLLDDLHEWALEGQELEAPITPVDAATRIPPFYREARLLALRMKSELGPEWSVTYADEQGAIRSV